MPSGDCPYWQDVPVKDISPADISTACNISPPFYPSVYTEGIDQENNVHYIALSVIGVIATIKPLQVLKSLLQRFLNLYEKSLFQKPFQLLFWLLLSNHINLTRFC